MKLLHSMLAALGWMIPQAQVPPPWLNQRHGRSRQPGLPGKAGDKLARMAAEKRLGKATIR